MGHARLLEPRLRVGVIGAGDISRYHLNAWSKVPDVDLVAICDLDGTRAESRARAYGIPAVYTDAATMLESERIDALDIATWRSTHVPLTLLAADHGIHVLCQKPLAETSREARELGDAVAGRIRLMVNENRRFGPQYRTIRQWIEEGRIGDVSQCIVVGYRSSLIKRPDGTRPAVSRAVHYAREARLMIAGALTHQIDLLRYLLGPLSLVAARTSHTETDLPGETVATVFLETGAGAAVIVAGNAVAPGFGDSPSAGGSTGGPSGERLELVGRSATVILDGDVLELLGPAPERIVFDRAQSYQACFDGAIASFVACLRSGEPFETSPEENLETLALVDAAYVSADAAR